MLNIRLSLYKILGFLNLPEHYANFLLKFIFLSNSISFVTLLSSTILILYVLQYVSIAEVGLLIGITFVIQSLLDYPSGNLGDYIGQKWVLFISMISYSLSFLLLCGSQSFSSFVVVYFLFGIAKSQESGALQSWFEKNYSFIAYEIDHSRVIYKSTLGKVTLGLQVFGGLSIVLGGLFSYLFTRVVVFYFQLGLYFILGICSILFINDFSTTVENKQGRTSTNMLSTFKLGIKFVISSKKFTIYVLGSILFSVTWAIWVELCLIPMYYGYTGSDFLAGAFRMVAYFLGIILVKAGSSLSIKVTNKSAISYFKLIHGLTVFTPFLLIFYLFPMNNEFTLIPILVYFVISILFPLFDLPGEFLEKTFYLETLPNEIRNSYYSLLSTSIALSSVPALVIGGLIIQHFGYPFVVFFILILLFVSTGMIWIALNLKSSKIEITKSQISQSGIQRNKAKFLIYFENLVFFCLKKLKYLHQNLELI